MSLLDHFQTLPPAFSQLLPLLIIGCFLLSFHHWLPIKWYTVILIYGLSSFTWAVGKAIIHDAKLAALLGEIIVPACFSILFIGFGVLRRLQMPYGYGMILRPARIHSSKLVRVLQGAIGACVGGVTGSTLGALFSILLLFLAFLASPGANFDLQAFHKIHGVIDGSIIAFGSVGTSLGGLAGWGYFNLRRLGDKFLIYLTINVFIAASVTKAIIKRFLVDHQQRK
jgi:hypothetical protein